MRVPLSIPDQTYFAAEKLAKDLGLSRSQLYGLALKAYLKTQEDEVAAPGAGKFPAEIDEPPDAFLQDAARRLLLNSKWEE